MFPPCKRSNQSLLLKLQGIYYWPLKVVFVTTLFIPWYAENYFAKLVIREGYKWCCSTAIVRVFWKIARECSSKSTCRHCQGTHHCILYSKPSNDFSHRLKSGHTKSSPTNTSRPKVSPSDLRCPQLLYFADDTLSLKHVIAI